MTGELIRFIRDRGHLWTAEECVELRVALDALGDPKTDNEPAEVLHMHALALSAPDAYERDAGNVLLHYLNDTGRAPYSKLLAAQAARIAWQNAFAMQFRAERRGRTIDRLALLDISPESPARLLTNIVTQDRAFWDSLPDTFTIYRGAAGVDPATAATGLSWTTRRDVAEQIAHHRAVDLGTRPVLISARIRKTDALTVFAMQHEIVTKVSSWTEEPLNDTWRFHLCPPDWIFGGKKQRVNGWTRYGHERAYARLSEHDRQQLQAGPRLTDWTFIGTKRSGVELGGIYSDGEAYWQVKSYVDPDHAASDHLAAQLYHAAGASVPETRLIALGEPYGTGVALAERIVPSVPVDPHNPDHLTAVQADFAADAWLACWDMPGPAYDNVRVRTSDGGACRVDLGGALDFRGQGDRKGENFGLVVPELDTMRDWSRNTAAASVFGSITTERLIASAAKVVAVTDATIRDLCDRHAPGTPGERTALADKLIARRDDIARQIAPLRLPDPR